MRGNLGSDFHQGSSHRSIPAYAGEPSSRQLGDLARTVYPRVCGGTGTIAVQLPIAAGLSPRMRGNLRVAVTRALTTGSIPAYAGEPITACSTRTTAWVYPRVCGGTKA